MLDLLIRHVIGPPQKMCETAAFILTFTRFVERGSRDDQLSLGVDLRGDFVHVQAGGKVEALPELPLGRGPSPLNLPLANHVQLSVLHSDVDVFGVKVLHVHFQLEAWGRKQGDDEVMQGDAF